MKFKILGVLLAIGICSHARADAMNCANSTSELQSLAQSGDPGIDYQHAILGRFESSHSFYVFEKDDQMYIGIDGGFLLGKMVYAIQACPQKDNVILIQAEVDGSLQHISAQILGQNGKIVLRLFGGTGRLALFGGDYVQKKDVSMKSIVAMFTGA